MRLRCAEACRLVECVVSSYAVVMTGRTPISFPCPPVLVHLPSARDRQRLIGHIVGDRRAGGHIGALADRDRRDELRVAANEGAVADDGLVLLLAVVVAGDRAGADVDVLADRRVSQIREVARFRLAAERGLFQLDEVADVGLALDDAARAEMRERAEHRVGLHRRIGDDAVIADGHSIAHRGVDQSRARVDLARRADGRAAFEVHIWMEDRIGADLDVGLHVRRRRVDHGDAGGQQLFNLGVAHET